MAGQLVTGRHELRGDQHFRRRLSPQTKVLTRHRRRREGNKPVRISDKRNTGSQTLRAKKIALAHSPGKGKLGIPSDRSRRSLLRLIR
jgi:hypothetical protein